MGMKPQRFLKAGDVVSLGIEGLGEQRQRFIAFEGNAVDTSKSWKGH
jgi:2,4-didehydro-3-deoxy-L-rhamnonate hydrolase